MNKNIAVIDIGSNSVRLLISSGAPINKKEIASTSLADGLSLTGNLMEERILATAKAVACFYEKAKLENCKQIYVFATEAVRAAKNGNTLVALLENIGIDVDVIDGDEEATIGYMGATKNRNDDCAVFDIGGASVEIICGKKNRITYKKSLPIGSVRLLDLFKNDNGSLNEFIAKKMNDYKTVPKTSALIGIGGTATSIGAMSLNLLEYNENKVHNLEVSYNTVLALEDKLLNLGGIDNIISAYPILSHNRAKIIKQGICLTKYILQYLCKDSFIISETDNMEGYSMRKFE